MAVISFSILALLIYVVSIDFSLAFRLNSNTNQNALSISSMRLSFRPSFPYKSQVMYVTPLNKKNKTPEATKEMVKPVEGVFVRRNLPVFGAFIGLTALSFQMFILYPWHETLRNDFDSLQVSFISH